MAEPGNESSVLDFTGQGIRRVEPIPNAWPTTLIYDRNSITKVENLDQYKDTLQQLSFGENQLTRMNGVARLTSLTMLNLPHNSITSIEGLKNLTRLTWLNLSGNCLKTAENLQYSANLQHLDLSDNSLSVLPDVGGLKYLKSLLLHGNLVRSLSTGPAHLPPSLSILSLAENDLEDLNEVAYLSTLPALEQLSIMNNPCIIMTGPNPGFDYRPFVVNWCLTLGFLDGYQVKEKERLKAEWLYSQGKGKHYRPGQHFALVQYLATVCPLTAAAELESMEDQKLARILQHQRLHQASLDEGQCRRPHTPSKGESPKPLQKESPKPGTPGGRRSSHDDVSTSRTSQLTSEEVTSQPGMYTPPYKGQPVKAWGQVDPGRSPSIRDPRLGDVEQRPSQPTADLQVQDITSSDDSPSMLESETRYIPLHTSELAGSPTKPFNDLLTPASTPARPVTAPPSSNLSAAPVYDEPERPVSDMDMPDAADYLVQKHLVAGGNHPARRMAANFSTNKAAATGAGPGGGQIKPAHSDMNPHGASVRKRSVSPLARGQEFAGTDSDSDTLSQEGSATLQLQLLKAILQNRKTKKAIRKSLHDASTHSSHSYSSGRDGGQQRAGSGQRVYGEEQENWRSGLDAEVEQVMSRSDERNHYEAELKLQTLAATRLQASWRGYLTRQKNHKALQVRHELRSRRSEDHINFLRSELERQRVLYEQEKQLRSVQLEAMKQLWRQVQTLQAWKHDVLQSQEIPAHVIPPNEDPLDDSTKQLIETLERASVTQEDVPAPAVSHLTPSHAPPRSAASPRPSVNFGPQPTAAQSVDLPGTSQKEVELEYACKHLQQQVSQLQEVLTSVSNFVFQGAGGPGDNVLSQGLRDATVSATVGADNMASEPPPPGPHTASKEKGAVVIPPTVAAPVATRLGVPTPPSCLQATSHAPGAIFLNWNPSIILDAQGQPSNRPLLGYRVYVNDQAKGMVGSSKHQTLLEGLSSTLHYRIYLRAVSALGESADSNVVLISPQAGDDIRLSQVADGDGDPDQSDGQDPASRHGPDMDRRLDGSGGGSSGQSSNPADPGLGGKGSMPGTQSVLRESTPSRIPTLRNRNLLHVQFDPADLDSSKGSTTLDGTKGSYTTLEGSTKGSTLETDSGYLTTLGSLSHKQESRLSTKASVAPSVAIETVSEEPNKRRTTVVERLEQKLKNPKDFAVVDMKQSSPTSTQENKNLLNKLLESERSNVPGGSSPRIQEGLIKRLEQTREKGMLGELKYAAAKIHRRRNESPTPLRAIPSELNRAESIAGEITNSRREQDAGTGSKSRSGVVVETPERLPRSRDSSSEQGPPPVPPRVKAVTAHSRTSTAGTEQKDSQFSSKAEGEASPNRDLPAAGTYERRLSDSKLENVSDPIGERRKARSLYEEEKLKSYFSRHNSLRYRVQVARPRVRTNSGGDEQEEPEKDTPAVEKALRSYRESKGRTESGASETAAADKDSSSRSERKISPVSTAERRLSPASTLEKGSPSEKTSPVAADTDSSSRSERKISPVSTAERRLSPASTLERKPSSERRSPGSKLPSPSRLAGPDTAGASVERRTLPDTPGVEVSRTRGSPSSSGGGSSSNSPTKPDRTPPAIPPRPSTKVLKDSGLRARSPSPARTERSRNTSPMKHRSERSREASPAGLRSRSDRGSENSEGIVRRGSLRRRNPSTGSEAGEEQQQNSGGSSPQKSSSDELSCSSASKYSTSESRSSSHRAGTQRGESPAGPGRHVSPSSSSIPVPTGDVQGREQATAPEDITRHSRGRRSAREPRNKKEVEVTQRSSSVGAVVDRITGGCCKADTVIVTDKPPMAKRDGSRENISGHKSSRENLHKGSRENISSHKPPISRTSSKEDVSGRRSSGRRRTHSEHSAAGSSEDDDGSLPRSGSRESFGERKSSSERSTGSGDLTDALQAALLAPAKTSPREKKPLLKHKRSNSDMSGIQALPDRPESPAPKDWKPSAPSKPNQAPSSPRVIRSSSFSKVLPGQDGSQGSPDALLRQCISLETLKAAKSHDIGHFEAKRSSREEATRSSQSEAPAPTDSPTSTTGIAFDKAAVVRRSLERCYGRNLEKNLGSSGGSSEGGARGGRPHSYGYGEELRSASDGASSAARTQRYSDSSMQDYDQAGGLEYDEDVMEVAREMEKLHALPSQAIGDDRSLRLDELRERRTKLGSKAADLFAKLQQRLSASKT